mmetsp:Transcript_5382/g.5225  ORF Transcript_5382/g.5225 Transcript_5382/m.5225 type:complete len:103 (-) Transcript_5382:31-339(-)
MQSELWSSLLLSSSSECTGVTKGFTRSPSICLLFRRIRVFIDLLKRGFLIIVVATVALDCVDCNIVYSNHFVFDLYLFCVDFIILLFYDTVVLNIGLYEQKY